MKIDPNSQSAQPVSRDVTIVRNSGPAARSYGTPQTSSASPGIDRDATRLSPAALAASSSSSLPDVRSEKVAAVQQALANGSYAVSASDVAGKLIDHLLQS